MPVPPGKHARPQGYDIGAKPEWSRRAHPLVARSRQARFQGLRKRSCNFANTFAGDKWSVCPPVSNQVATCTASFAYSDIAFTKTGAVTPTFVTTPCTVGP